MLVLLVEDSLEDAELLERHFTISGFQVSIDRVANSSDMRDALANRDYDVVIADYTVPGFGAIPALRLLKQSGRDIPFIILSGTMSDETAVAAMRAGAQDYVVKGNLSRLLPAMEREIQEAVARRHKRQMEVALHEADKAVSVGEARLQGIIGSAMDAIITIGADQHILVFNAAAEKIFGCPATEAIGHPLDRFIPATLREDHRRHVQAFAGSGSTSRSMHSPGILYGLQANGEEFPIEATISHVTVDGEKLYTVILRDITERRQAEYELHKSEARFRSVLEDTRDVIYRMNLQTGRYEYISPSAQAVEGLSQDELMALGPESGPAEIHPDDLPAVQSAWARLGETGREDAEYRQRSKSGDYRWISNHMSLVRDSAGRPLYRDGNLRDITERKRAEEALLRSEKLATVGRMAATIAHEINNPLAAVTNLLFLMGASENLTEPARQYLDMVDAELKRIAHITRLSLGFYRESEAMEKVSLSAVLESTLDLLKSKVKAKQAVIEKDWDEQMEVTAKAGELRQIFSNLIINGLDAIDERGTVKVRVSAAHPDLRNGQRCVRVTIADNGLGIPASAREHIFEPFFTTKGTVGNGLGLWATRQIVDKHSGTIRVRSSTGGAHRGTSFSVVLPVDQPGKV
jgi:PAS domain S-box-containing protein